MQNQTVSKNREKKEQIVASLTQKAEKAKALVFTNYQGLTHLQLEKLKKAAKTQNAEFVASKNTLFLRALASKNLDETAKKHFQKPTAALFIYEDIVEPLKVLTQAVKEFNLPEIKFGLFEQKTLSAEDVLRLSNLPPLPVLRAQLLGQLLSPVQALHRSLSWNLQAFVMTLNAIKNKKE